jgi:hypothetical protein
VVAVRIPDEYKQALIRGRNDPVFFCRYFLELELHPGQQAWLQKSTKKENLLVTGNRYGKSHIAAAKRIWKMTYKIGWPQYDLKKPYSSVNASITADQARIVWDKVMTILQQAPKLHWLIDEKKTKQTPFPTLVFRNNSQLQARSTQRNGIYLLGHDYDDFNFDEAAYQKGLMLLLDNVIRMRLADRNGDLDLTSTANKRNDYYRLYLRGIEGTKEYDPFCYSQTGNSFDNPYVSHEALERISKHMTADMKKQNIEGGFPDSSGEVFTGEQVEFLFDQDIEFDHWGKIDPEDGTAELCWNNPQPGRQYYHGWDLAKRQDWTVGFTVDVMKNPWQVVAYERFQHRPWPYVYERIRHRHKLYAAQGMSETWIDCTGIGDVVLDELQDIQAQGLNFAGKRKVDMLINMQTVLQNRGLKAPWIREPVDEFSFYEWDDEEEELVQDCVMALGVALWGARDLGLPLDKETRELLRGASLYG